MYEGIVAAIATLFGAIGLKLFEFFLSRRVEKKKQAEAEKVLQSQEHAAEIADLKQELEALEKKMMDTVFEMDKWREQYWTLREQHSERLDALNTAKNTIKSLSEKMDEAITKEKPK